MYATLEQVKQFNKQKKLFANMFKANESTVQKCFDELISIAKNNNNYLTTETILTFASSDTTKLYNVFDWTSEQENRITLAQQLLNSLSFIIGSDNVLYTLEK